MEIVTVAAVFIAGVTVGLVVSTPSTSSPDSVRGTLEERREELRSAYENGEISHDQFAREIELVEDPATEKVMHAACDVDGVGPSTALELAREYRSPEALANADVDDLARVNGIGDNRARAIESRLSGAPA